MIGHRCLPQFSEHTGQAECVRVQSKSPIKFKQKQKNFHQNYSEERVAWKKHPQTFLTEESLEKIQEKTFKRLRGESWKQFEFEPCYTCEKTSQLSYKSRVLHSIGCVRLRGYIREGGLPQFSLFCLFLYICRQKICNYGYYTCVPIRKNLFRKS